MSEAAWIECPSAVPQKPISHPQYNACNSGSDLRVIVADDSEDGARSLALLLSLLGAHAEPCCSGPEALKAASADPPDAILSEIRLPGMDGSEFVRRLRERIELQKTLLIAVTAWADERSRRMAQEAGFQLFCVKPLGEEEIKEILKLARRFKEG
jgi:two-component system CheB/CheR fusion protein